MEGVCDKVLYATCPILCTAQPRAMALKATTLKITLVTTVKPRSFHHCHPFGYCRLVGSSEKSPNKDNCFQFMAFSKRKINVDEPRKIILFILPNYPPRCLRRVSRRNILLSRVAADVTVCHPLLLPY